MSAFSFFTVMVCCGCALRQTPPALPPLPSIHGEHLEPFLAVLSEHISDPALQLQVGVTC